MQVNISHVAKCGLGPQPVVGTDIKHNIARRYAFFNYPPFLRLDHIIRILPKNIYETLFTHPMFSYVYRCIIRTTCPQSDP